MSITQCVQLCEQLDFCLALQFRQTRCYLLVLLDNNNLAEEAITRGCLPGRHLINRGNSIVIQKSPSCFQGREQVVGIFNSTVAMSGWNDSFSIQVK